jgi:hypothetical protein
VCYQEEKILGHSYLSEFILRLANGMRVSRAAIPSRTCPGMTRQNNQSFR